MQMQLIVSESAGDWLNKFGADKTDDKVLPGGTSIHALVTMSETVSYTDMIISTCKMPTPLSATSEEEWVRSAFIQKKNNYQKMKQKLLKWCDLAF